MIRVLDISSYRASLRFETSDREVIDYFLKDPLPRNHIPGYMATLRQKGEKDNPEFIFRHTYSLTKKPQIVWLATNIINVITPSKIPPGQFVFAFLPIFEKLYEEKNLYGFHAASLQINEWTVFLIGGTKAGKSTIAAKLHYDYGAKLISDEKTIIHIDMKTIVESTETLSMRRSVFKGTHNILNLKDLRKHRWRRSLSTPKLYFLPREGVNCPLEVHKALFVFPHLGDVSLSVENINDFVLSYLLYDNITSTIRSCISLFIEDELPFPSQDNDLLAEKRARAIRRFLKEVPHRAIDVTGTIPEVISCIFSETGGDRANADSRY